MFLRIKKRINPSGKTYEYAYWVANKYRKRRKMPKQKVKKYLGRVYKFKKALNQEIEVIETEKTTFRQNILLLIKNELKNYEFEEKEGFWQKENCQINVEQGLCIDEKGKNICIAINEGFLHATTITALIDFKPKEDLEREIGKQLGNTLISAGIRPKEAVFIELFRQVMKQIHQINNDKQ